jgi:UDP-glucose 4-epimerase
VKDIVRALRLAMGSDYHGILNVGTGTAYRFNEVIDLINKVISSEIKPKYVNNPIKNYVGHTLADTNKTKSVLGFEAKCALSNGIKSLIEFEKKG